MASTDLIGATAPSFVRVQVSTGHRCGKKCKSHTCLFGVKSHAIFFWCRLCMEINDKKGFFWHKSRTQKKKRTIQTTQQPPLLPEEEKHVAPTDFLGTSSMG